MVDFTSVEPRWSPVEKQSSDLVQSSDFRFKEMKAFVKNLKVVNNTAEGGVKLMENFGQSITKNLEQTQNLLQSIEESTKEKTLLDLRSQFSMQFQVVKVMT
ncbi:hypothetical protein AVEN_126442-1 [Araneus ventricosus]|uniref:Uncharacterized protein n=1 Tax=Araneus ventricosus TaxID=182803 RepID=A0A4Y2DH89_ARAVE|nr:hypothetical protein AVEN_126442-1 [Araneus ventricosus]